MTLDRRSFLRMTGAATGLAAASRLSSPLGVARAATSPPPLLSVPAATPPPPLLSVRAATPPPALLSVPAAHAPIDTIVVMMMENRSFDHYFGWLSADDAYMETGRRRHGASFTVQGANHFAYAQPDGKLLHTHHLTGQAPIQDPTRGCGHPDPGHGWDQGRAQRDHGFVARGTGNDVFALGYFEAADLPCYTPLVRAFTTFDHYHAAIMSSTYPNRLYLQSGQSGGLKDPPLPLQTGGFHWPCIWDRLRAAGVSAANYCVDLPQSLFFGTNQIQHVRPIEAFFADAATGLLPHVSFIDPGFTSGLRTDDHPVGDHRLAQAVVANVFRAFHDSSHWRRGALIVTYDEWGGFFDHVRPPVVPDIHAARADEENFGQVGFRVPTIVASPYARTGYVDHRLYDHTSILRFIEWRFLGAPPEGSGGHGWWLTTRDRYANNLAASLVAVPDADARLDPATLLPDLSLPCVGRTFQDTPGLDDVEKRLIHQPRGNAPALEVIGTHPMEAAADAGYFDRLGYRVRPSMTLAELTG